MTACETRTVGETGIDHRRRTVEPQAERCDHPLDQVHDRVGVELEDDGLQTTRPLDVGAPRTVDHHFGDRRVGEQWLERTEARDFVRELLEQLVETDGRQQRLLVPQELAEARPERGVVGRADVVGTLRDQAAVHALLERAVAVATMLDLGGEHERSCRLTRRPLPGRPLPGRPVRRCRAGARGRTRPRGFGQPGRQHTGIHRARAIGCFTGTRARTGMSSTSLTSRADSDAASLLEQHRGGGARQGR